MQNLRASVTAYQPNYHYRRYHEHFLVNDSQKLGTEFDYLFTAFKDLPNLKSICFDSGIDNGDHSYRPDFLDRLGQIGREALVELDDLGSFMSHYQ